VKLLDAATVTPGTGDWERGWDGDPRECSGISVYLSECDPEATSDVIGDQDGDDPTDACAYRVVPFGIVAELRRSTRSAQEDDVEWLSAQLRASAEIPVSRGLLVRQGMGIARRDDASVVGSDTWIGNPDVHQIPAPAPDDSNAVASAVAEGRAWFFGHTIGISPILHVSPAYAITLKKAGVVELDPANGEDRTVWGDPVVISEGYSDIGGLSPVPMAFWTGPIEITLGEVDAEEIIRQVRTNRSLIQATMRAAIDTPPCAMVRIGAAPAPVTP
jgi:hypothetical protein